MKNINDLHTTGKSSRNIQSKKTKGFGYQVLGFGSGGAAAAFVTATGGNTTITCGDYKTHIFTGPGTFCVSCAGSVDGSDSVDYFVVAGGGSTNHDRSAGAGAGGLRNASCVSVTATPYAIAVG